MMFFSFHILYSSQEGCSQASTRWTTKQTRKRLDDLLARKDGVSCKLTSLSESLDSCVSFKTFQNKFGCINSINCIAQLKGDSQLPGFLKQICIAQLWFVILKLCPFSSYLKIMNEKLIRSSRGGEGGGVRACWPLKVFVQFSDISVCASMFL